MNGVGYQLTQRKLKLWSPLNEKCNNPGLPEAAPLSLSSKNSNILPVVIIDDPFDCLTKIKIRIENARQAFVKMIILNILLRMRLYIFFHFIVRLRNMKTQ